MQYMWHLFWPPFCCFEWVPQGCEESSNRYSAQSPVARPLQKISQELGKSIDLNKLMEDMSSSSDSKANAEEFFFDYCEQQQSIQPLLREFRVSRKDLKELYDKLIMAGAGQWTCGHWVPASALAYPESLRYILCRRKENIQETAFNIIMYFEQGSPLKT